MNSVFAIIVTYNPEVFLLEKQLNSVLKQVDRVIYIDNGSSNFYEFKDLLCLNKSCEIVKLNTNKGLAHAQNRGISLAKQNGATHILLLDHDSVLESDFVQNLIMVENDLLSKGIKVGAIGPVFYDPLTMRQYPVQKYNRFSIKSIYPEREPVEVSFLIASGTLIRLSVLDDIGHMNEGLFIDKIDHEWCSRALYNNYKLIVTPLSRMSHQVGDKRVRIFTRSIAYHSPQRRYYSCRNSIHALKFKGYPFSFKLKAIVYPVLRMIIYFVIGPMRIENSKNCIQGFYHGIKGYLGVKP